MGKSCILSTPAIAEYIRGAVDTTSDKRMAEEIKKRFGVDTTNRQIKTWRHSHKVHAQVRRHGLGKHCEESVFKWEVQTTMAWLCVYYTDKEMAEFLSEHCGVTYRPQQLKSWRGNHKIRNGRSGYFHTEKGGRPHKAKKGDHRSPATEFKKGHRPHNWRPVGFEVVSTDGYNMVKVAEPNIWKMKSRLVWQKAHPGENLEADDRIIHIDGNRLNDAPENLRKIKNSVLATVNKLYPLGENVELNTALISVCEINNKLKNAIK